MVVVGGFGCGSDLETITNELCKKDLETLERAVNAEK